MARKGNSSAFEAYAFPCCHDGAFNALVSADHPARVAVCACLVALEPWREETDRFVWMGMPIPRDAKGLFALRFTRNGDLVERIFLPAAIASKMDALPAGARDDKWLIIWRAGSESISPKWLNREKAETGIWWEATHKVLQELTPQHESHGLVWELTPKTCTHYF